MATMAHEFCWIELATGGVDAARSFYADLFGWSFTEAESESGAYSMFEPAAGGPGGGMMAKPSDDVPTAWMPYVAVDDLAASVARVEELGGEVRIGPTPVPGHGELAVIADPSGGTIGLWRSQDVG